MIGKGLSPSMKAPWFHTFTEAPSFLSFPPKAPLQHLINFNHSMAETTNSQNFFWGSVFFKVEQTLFCVPRCEFEQSSEVFENMFLFPSENPEGHTQEHPIVLEGYKADDFTCLLNVMYPRAKSLISGTSINLHLQKEEWVSMLKLSTIWSMTKIREYAIHRLSTNVTLTAVEKFHLARAHKVVTWFEEGLKSLSSLFNNDTICYNCDASLAADEELSFSGTGSPSGSNLDRIVSIRGIKCGRCSGNSFYSFSTIQCNSCSCSITPKSNVRVTPKNSLDNMIKEVFGTEIENCRWPWSTSVNMEQGVA
ncbi:hypothetical protein CPB84DRAFT_1827697 [Gymnopilus junonius]|uniref:BTB domain-containing protein n=1 Tax=Gymnopilus junonius TaxID=109634 RepID=A0A9P5NH56_GYMJU|nr:hypothetical protein CPB84DRAFT_1827697 [Gymnopilus junonius]